MKYLGSYKSYPVYSFAPGVTVRDDELEENTIYIMGIDSMYMNGNLVGRINRGTGRVLSWWPENVTPYWDRPKPKAKIETDSTSNTKTNTGVEAEFNIETLDLNAFCAEIDKALEKSLNVEYSLSE